MGLSTDTYVINGSSTSTANGITVSGSGTVNITLNSVIISSSGCSFAIGSGVTVNLTLIGSNTLTSDVAYAGLSVPRGAVLNITSDSTGSINAHSGRYGAGIGGSEYLNKDSGAITISGGIVNAYGGFEGAGIGGGCSGNGGDITINAGTVYAVGLGAESSDVDGGGGAGIAF